MTTTNVAAGADGSQISVEHETLWSTDPRVGLDPASAADQGVGLNAMLNLLATSTAQRDRVGYLVPGTYWSSVELDLPNTNGHKPPRLKGAGGKLAADAPTVIRHIADAGSTKYAFKPTSNQAVFDIEGIAFWGSSNPVVAGTADWLMRGILLPNRCHLRDVSVQGYFSGFSFAGDHMELEDFIAQGNAYNLEVPPNNPTQGDIILSRGQAGAARLAAWGVARSSVLAGLVQRDVELSTSPHCIRRYDDGTGATLTIWLNGLEIHNAATEFTGNGIVYDAVGDGASINDIYFDHGSAGNLGLYSDHIDPGSPQTAAWYNTGSITNLRFGKSLPTATATQPALQAPKIQATCDFADMPNSLYTALKNGLLPFKRTGASVSDLNGSYVGTNRGFSSLIVPFIAAGTIARGCCLTNNNEYDMVQYSGPVSGRTKRVYAIAAHAATSGGTIHGGVRGNSSDCVALNTSGVTIAADTLVGPDPGGGVQTYSGSGQVLGRVLQSVANGALGQLDLFIQ